MILCCLLFGLEFSGPGSLILVLWPRSLGLGSLFLARSRPFGPDSLDLALSLALALRPRLTGPGLLYSGLRLPDLDSPAPTH